MEKFIKNRISYSDEFIINKVLRNNKSKMSQKQLYQEHNSPDYILNS